MKNSRLPLFLLSYLMVLLLITDVLHAQTVVLPFSGQVWPNEEGALDFENTPYDITAHLVNDQNGQSLDPVTKEDVNIDENGFFNFAIEIPEQDYSGLGLEFFVNAHADISISNEGEEIINISVPNVFPDFSTFSHQARVAYEISEEGMDQNIFEKNDEGKMTLKWPLEEAARLGVLLYDNSTEQGWSFTELGDHFVLDTYVSDDVPIRRVIYDIQQPMQDVFGLGLEPIDENTDAVQFNPPTSFFLGENIPDVKEGIEMGSTLEEGEQTAVAIGVNGAPGPSTALSLFNNNPTGGSINSITSQGSSFFSNGTEELNVTIMSRNANTEGDENTNIGLWGIVDNPDNNDYAGVFDGAVCIRGGNMVIDGEIVNASDRKRKSGISEFDNALARVMALQPKTYYLDQPNARQRRRPRFGFIAQELEKTFPNLVSEVTLPNVNTDKQLILESTETFKAVNYLELIPVLTKAMQEQQKTIEELKATVRALQEELSQLETK